MENTTPTFGTQAKIFWAVVLTVEVVVIMGSNILALKTFLHLMSLAGTPKPTYLLINQTIADLLVGVAVLFNLIEVIGYNQFLFLPCHGVIINEVSLTFTVFTSFASLICLALIALERMLAMIMPFRFHNSSKKNYIIAIVVSWCFSIPYMIIRNMTDCDDPLRHLYFIANITTAILTMVISYTIISIKIKFFTTMQSSIAQMQSINLSKTMQLATIFSVITWIPRFIAGRMGLQRKGVEFANVYMAMVALMYGNSFANVLIYTLRMTRFRRELRNVCGWRLWYLTSICATKTGVILLRPSFVIVSFCCSLTFYKTQQI